MWKPYTPNHEPNRHTHTRARAHDHACTTKTVKITQIDSEDMRGNIQSRPCSGDATTVLSVSACPSAVATGKRQNCDILPFILTYS